MNTTVNINAENLKNILKEKDYIFSEDINNTIARNNTNELKFIFVFPKENTEYSLIMVNTVNPNIMFKVADNDIHFENNVLTIRKLDKEIEFNFN